MSGHHNSSSMIERMEASARVSRFITDDEDYGRWRIFHFEVDEHHHRMSIARAIGEGGPNRHMRVARTIPEGEYVSLLRKATPGELQDIADGTVVDAYTDDGPNKAYIPVMSDTPTEIREMGHALKHAHGRVLITGLGLGCLVAGLLSNPDVTEIVVVEIDRDVIALTGKWYKAEPRVTIVNDDAIRFAAGYDGPDFDYAWHDIWTHIGDRNLDDDSLAEHGISYESMFVNYDRFCDHQGAWGYIEALHMSSSRTCWMSLRRRTKPRARRWKSFAQPRPARKRNTKRIWM